MPPSERKGSLEEENLIFLIGLKETLKLNGKNLKGF